MNTVKWKEAIILIIIVTISILVFLCHKFIFPTTIQDISHLSAEISSNDSMLATWRLGETPPFKYRVLFMWIVKASHACFFDFNDNLSFYYVFLFFSFLFTTAAGITLFYFLKTLGFNKNFSLLGSLIFYISTPILFAYVNPVHTREDPLAYFILLIGLIYILKNNNIGILIISIFGVLCRETLLILPFIYLFFTNSSISLRLITATVSISTFFLLRFFLGYEPYNIFGQGLFYNLENWKKTIGYFYLTFGFLWFLFFLYLLKGNNSNLKKNKGLTLIFKSSPWAFMLILLSSLIVGRISEIRLLFLSFPWVISLSLAYLKENIKYFRKLTLPFVFKVYAVILLIPLILVLNQYNGRSWVILSIIHLYILLLTAPILFIKKIFLPEQNLQ